VVVIDSHGVPDFAALHADLAAGRTDRLLYYAFDLLYLDGFDLRSSPLLERKRVLAELLSSADVGRILFSEHLDGEGSAIFKRACEMRLEGVISKRTDAPYRSGRGESWIQTKCIKRDAFPIVAFVEKLGAKPRRIASLYLGRLWAVRSNLISAYGLAAHGSELPMLPVSRLMTKIVLACSPEDSIIHAMKLMTQRRIRHLPVVKGGQLVGIISIGDVLKHRLDELELEANVMRDYAVVARR
jgi:CBS domain-containing protein